MMKHFVDSIFSSKITLDEFDKKQNNLLNFILEFSSRSRLKSKANKKRKILMKA